MSTPITAWYAVYYLGSFAIGLTIVLSILKAVFGGRRRGETGDPREEIERARREERERLHGVHRRFARTRRLGCLAGRRVAALAWSALVIPGRVFANLRCTDAVEEDLDLFAQRLHARGHRLTRPLCLVTPLTVHWLVKCVGCGTVAHLVESSHYGGETELRVAGGRLYDAAPCAAHYLPKRAASPRPAARPAPRPRPRLARPTSAATRGPVITPLAAPPLTTPAQPPVRVDVDDEHTRSASA